MSEPRSALPAVSGPQEPGAVAVAEAPAAQPRVVAWVESPGAWTRIEMATTTPRVVPVAGSIHDRAVVRIASEVAGQVAHIDVIRRHVVDVDVSHVVDRAARRNIIHSDRPRLAHPPWAIGAVGDVPHALIACVVAIIGEDHLGVGVHGVLHAGARNGLELG